MPSSDSAGLSPLPSSFSSSEHKSDSSLSNYRSLAAPLLHQPSSTDLPTTADHVIEIELSLSSEELASWRRRHQHTGTESMPWPGRIRSAFCRYSPLVPPVALLITLVVLLVQDLANKDVDSSELPRGSSEPLLSCSN